MTYEELTERWWSDTPRMTHAWCSNCNEIRETDGPSLPHPYATSRFHGGDITCQSCAWIIATVYVLRSERLAALDSISEEGK